MYKVLRIKRKEKRNNKHSLRSILHTRYHILDTHHDGFSTLEILIAFAILITTLVATVTLSFGSQSIGLDTETNHEALNLAKENLENLRALSRESFETILPVVSTNTIQGTSYEIQDLILDSQCLKEATIGVTWATESSRPQRIELEAIVTNWNEAIRLGGDCVTTPPFGNWENLQKFGSANFSPGRPTAIDALRTFVYIGADTPPFFYIANVENAAPVNNPAPFFIAFSNGFNAGVAINDIDVATLSNGKTYAFVARATSTQQFGMINVSNPATPTSITRSLSGVSGSNPEGFRIAYFDNKVYITARYTAGPEFHIFDVSNPMNPVEMGSGTELGSTVEDMAIEKRKVGGTTHTIVYFAMDANVIHGEVIAYDVTNPLSPYKISGANTNLPGNQDGASLYRLGNKLYFGRTSVPSGPDLYIFDIQDPFSASGGLPILASKDIGAGVTAIRANGKIMFLATTKATKELQVWPAEPLKLTAAPSAVSTYNLPRIAEQAIDYEDNRMYASSNTDDSLRIIYNP